MIPNAWSKDEEQILKAHYPERGSAWEGWEALLPGRGERAIRGKAQRMGLSMGVRHNRPKVSLSSKANDPEIKRLMSLGWAPSMMDASLGLPPGMAHDRIVSMWADGWGSGYAHGR